MDVELEDVPGQLIKVLEPIAKGGGNIVGVVHHRNHARGSLVKVTVTFDLSEPKRLDEILSELRKRKISILRMGGERKTHAMTAILIGHVFATNIKDTIDRVMATGAAVRKVDARIKSPEEVSSVKLIIEADTEEELTRACQELKKAGREKDLFIIRS